MDQAVPVDKLIKYIMLLILCVCLSSCKPSINKSENYNFRVSKLIFSNNGLKDAINKAFNLSDKPGKIFKVLISRRDRFVRITIYQLIFKIQKDEYPSSFFTYNSNTFLCYDGYEIIANKKLDSVFMNRVNEHLQSELMIFDSRVIQFDVDAKGNVKLNMPAINPYDLREIEPFKFPNPKNKR
jgi:hypothetical protein